MNTRNYIYNQNTERISRGQLRRTVIALVLPIIAENMLISLVEYVDTAMVGSLGAGATASVACTVPVIWFVHSLVMALSVGATVTVAQSIGARNASKAKQICSQAFLAVTALGLTIMAILLLLHRQIPVLMGVDPEIYTMASSYMAILALGLPFQFASSVFFGIIRGAGDTRTPMRFTLFTNALNIAGNFLLIFPSRQISLFGLTLSIWGAGLGVVGAAVSSSIARAVSGLILLYIMTRRPDVPLQLTGLRPDCNILAEILRIGLPAALERLAINGGHLLYARLVAGLGTVTLAAHQLCLTAENICFLPAIGFGTAATTLAGQAVGARQNQEARRRVWMTAELCIYCVLFTSVILFFGCQFLLGLLTPAEEVIAEGCKALRVVAFFEVFYGIATVFADGLRGVGSTKQPLFICLGSMWLVRIPLALLFLHVFHGGIASVWLAMSIDLVVRASLMTWRFHSKSWEHKLENRKEFHYD